MDMGHPLQRYSEREAARELFTQHLTEECADLQLSAEGDAALPHLQMALAAFIDSLDVSAMEEFLQQAEEAAVHDQAEEQRGGLGTRLLGLTTIMPGETPAQSIVTARAGMAMISNLTEHCSGFPLSDFLSCARRALRQTPFT